MVLDLVLGGPDWGSAAGSASGGWASGEEGVRKRWKAVREAYWAWISDSILSRRFTLAW